MSDYLTHHGILGMKWGIRRTPAQLGYKTGDSSVTKKVKDNYNKMSDEEFRRKYQTTKKTYARRVRKYGDPYMNAPLAKLGKKLEAKKKDNKKTKPPIKTMSDEELRKVVNRLQMERQYSQLTSESVSKGREYTKKVVKAGTTVAAVTTTALTIYNNAGKIKAILEKKVKEN